MFVVGKTTFLDALRHFFAATANPATVSLAKNGSVLALTPSSYTPGTFTPTKVTLAGFNGSSAVNLMFGGLGEIVLYGRALSAGEAAALRRYLGAKWAITVHYHTKLGTPS